jgi:hypothetical protein
MPMGPKCVASESHKVIIITNIQVKIMATQPYGNIRKQAEGEKYNRVTERQRRSICRTSSHGLSVLNYMKLWESETEKPILIQKKQRVLQLFQLKISNLCLV